MHAMGPNVAGVQTQQLLQCLAGSCLTVKTLSHRNKHHRRVKSGDDCTYHRNINKPFVSLLYRPAVGLKVKQPKQA